MYKFERGNCKNSNCSYVHPTVLCEQFSKQGMCGKVNCLDLHVGEHRADCFFWMKGNCRYSEAECGKGRHLPERLGVNEDRRDKDDDSFLENCPSVPSLLEQLNKQLESQRIHPWQAGSMPGRGMGGTGENRTIFQPNTQSTPQEDMINQRQGIIHQFQGNSSSNRWSQ